MAAFLRSMDMNFSEDLMLRSVTGMVIHQSHKLRPGLWTLSHVRSLLTLTTLKKSICLPNNHPSEPTGLFIENLSAGHISSIRALTNNYQHKRQKRDLLTWPKFRCYKLMPGNKTSPHVQIFMKLMLHLPPWKSVQSCATIDHSQEHAAMLNVLSLMHPWGAHSDKRFSRVARHRGVSLKVQRKSLT